MFQGDYKAIKTPYSVQCSDEHYADLSTPKVDFVQCCAGIFLHSVFIFVNSQTCQFLLDKLLSFIFQAKGGQH